MQWAPCSQPSDASARTPIDTSISKPRYTLSHNHTCAMCINRLQTHTHITTPRDKQFYTHIDTDTGTCLVPTQLSLIPSVRAYPSEGPHSLSWPCCPQRFCPLCPLQFRLLSSRPVIMPADVTCPSHSRAPSLHALPLPAKILRQQKSKAPVSALAALVVVCIITHKGHTGWHPCQPYLPLRICK